MRSILGTLKRAVDDNRSDRYHAQKGTCIMANTTTVLPDNRRVIRGVQSQLGLLAAQFLAGMGVNVLGLPSEATEAGVKLTSTILLGLHVVVALGLIGGTFGVYRRLPSQLKPWGSYAGIALVVSFIFGGLAMGEWLPELWSYLMAVGFLVAAALYAYLFGRLSQR